MTTPELRQILDDRFFKRITDEEAVQRLMALGESEAEARDHLMFQDELYGNDRIEEGE